jgi:hypothetical protein
VTLISNITRLCAVIDRERVAYKEKVIDECAFVSFSYLAKAIYLEMIQIFITIFITIMSMLETISG